MPRSNLRSAKRSEKPAEERSDQEDSGSMDLDSTSNRVLPRTNTGYGPAWAKSTPETCPPKTFKRHRHNRHRHHATGNRHAHTPPLRTQCGGRRSRDPPRVFLFRFDGAQPLTLLMDFPRTAPTYEASTPGRRTGPDRETLSSRTQLRDQSFSCDHPYRPFTL